MNFFAMVLDKFPATFHLSPHAFNWEVNFNYSGENPPINLAWHAGKVLEQAVFNFQEELLHYCESDVKLLNEGCLKFV